MLGWTVATTGERETASRSAGAIRPQTAAPIGAVRYALCPAANVGGETRDCAEGTVRGTRRVRALRSPRPATRGMAAQPLAGGRGRQRGPGAGRVGRRPALRRRRADPADRAAATIATPRACACSRRRHVGHRRRARSRRAARARTHGARSPRRSLRTGSRRRSTTRRCRAGRYELRARVVDRAGNERSTQTLPNGDAGDTHAAAAGRDAPGRRQADAGPCPQRQGQVAVPHRPARESERAVRAHDPAARAGSRCPAATRSRAPRSRCGSG